MIGGFLYFFIYVAQQLGVMLGVGAQTVLLCAHLTALHHGEKESPHAHYARAAHLALGVGLLLIIVSGLVAVGVHLAGGQTNILLAPAFLFKWFLITLLLGAFFFYNAFFTKNSYYALTGGTWYALFLVHSLGPVTSWVTLWVLYIVWGVFFSCVWFCFAAVMKWRARVSVPLLVQPLKPLGAIAKPVPPPTPTLKPSPPPVIPEVKNTPVPTSKPPEIKIAVVPISPPIIPIAVPIATAVTTPIVQKKSWWRTFFTWGHKKEEEHSVVVKVAVPTPHTPTPPPTVTPAPLPTIKTTPIPLSGLAQKTSVPAPALVPALKSLALSAHTEKPATSLASPPMPPVFKKIEPVSTVVAAPPPAATASTSIVQDVIDHILVPALHIMPRTAEDIGKQRRPPVVK